MSAATPTAQAGHPDAKPFDEAEERACLEMHDPVTDEALVAQLSEFVARRSATGVR